MVNVDKYTNPMDPMGLGPHPFATFPGEVFAPTFQVAQDLAASTVQETGGLW